MIDFVTMKMITAAACMAIGGLAPALAEGYIGGKALEAMGRNPSIQDKIASNMLVAMAIVESIAIYSLIISLIILFVLKAE